MWYIIVMVVLAFGLWLSKPYIIKFIHKYKQNKKITTYVKNDLVYTPVLSSRVFDFSIEISEVGQGKATISVIKTK